MEKLYADSTLNFTKGVFPKPTRPLSIELDCSKYENPLMNQTDSLGNLITPVKKDDDLIEKMLSKHSYLK